MKSKSKWVRYFNIIIGIPNKKQRVAPVEEYECRSIEPASRQTTSLRNGTSTWQLKTDFDDLPAIQHCEQSF